MIDHRWSVSAAALACLVMVGCGNDSPQPDEDSGTDVGTDAVEDTDEDVGDDAADAADTSDVEPDIQPDVEPDIEPDVIIEGALNCLGDAQTATVSPGSGAILELAVENTPSIGIDTEFVGREVSAASDVTLACAPDNIVPAGFIPISPAFNISAEDGRLRFDRRFSAALPYNPGEMPDGARVTSIRVFHMPDNRTEATQPVVLNLQENAFRANVRFESELTGTFQLGVAENAGEVYDRHWNFRAVTGISMGASGASVLGVRNIEDFDIIGPLGGPTDYVYLMHYIREGGMGGFGAAPDFPEGVSFTPDQEFEHNMSFDNWYFPSGEGSGGAFNRSDYTDIFLDLMLAFGNIVQYSDESPMTAPGLPLSEMQRPWNEICPGGDDVFTIETGFVDDEFNPDGSLPVILFCDGQPNRDRSIEFDRACDIDGIPGPDSANEGLYRNPESQTTPVVITYAVDLNGNGMRDPGEPVIRNFYEPFSDFGTDGIPSIDEDGYDAITNPDPAGDDYDYINNSFGTEGNWLYEEGEPYDDFGIDGVEGSAQLADGGYDFGEGNGVFNYNPNLGRMLEERAQRIVLANHDPEVLDHVTFFMDAGVRDLFNFGTVTNQLAGTLNGLGENIRVYDGFYSIEDLPVEQRDSYNFNNVDYENLGEHVYLRYGSIDASEEDTCYGDGKHVGTVTQVANRLLTLLAFTLNRFPEGDRTTIQPPYPLASGTYYAETDAGDRLKYSIVLPPGYERTQCSDGRDNDGDGNVDGRDSACRSAEDTSEAGDASITRCNDGLDNDDDGVIDAADADCAAGGGLSEWPVDSPFRVETFPVVYLMHGYGQTPDELQVTALPFAGFMASGNWAKAIIVYPDGFCGETEVTQCNDGVDNDVDGNIDEDDAGCAESGGRSESGEMLSYCEDGVDNDLDGFADLEDGGCSTAAWDDEANCVQGNFYTNHVAWPDGTPGGPQYEDQFFDLIDHIDSTYRVREPGDYPETRD